MSIFKRILAARCPQCDAKLHYTGWSLPYPKYICQHCANVQEMDMDIAIVQKTIVRLTEEEQLTYDNFVKRRREKQRNIIVKRKSAPANVHKEAVVTTGVSELYICRNFTTKSSICDRCRCNIWHHADRIENFREYRDCYEPTIFEIKPLTAQ